MFVQALAEYADRKLQEQLKDPAFEDRPIPYFLELNDDGSFAGIKPRFVEELQPGKKGGKAKVFRRAMSYRVPRSPVNRNAGSHPILGADDIVYLLGVGPWNKPEDAGKVQKHHQAFVALIARVAEETGEGAAQACARFYAQPEEVEKARTALTDISPGQNLALSVAGPIVDVPALKVWWRHHYETETSALASIETAECLISGLVGPIPPTHPKIKHTAALGGQASGVSLMSFDKGAFRSYGWEQCANSPVSLERAMAYVMALNDLLKPGSAHRRDFDGVAFLFWLRKDEAGESDPFAMVVDPDPDQVNRLLDLNHPARSLSTDPDPNFFYMAAVSANGSRLILRTWLTETLPQVKNNLRDWFAGLRIQPLAVNQQAAPPALWQLLRAIDREGKPPADRTVALIRRALEGPQRPLGARILHSVLQRFKVDPANRLNLPSLGLLRLCLNDVHYHTGEGELVSASLEPHHTHPAYVCGRILALHDSLQWKTFDTAGEGQPNSTVADRYYSLVMTSPAIGSAKVFDLGRKHLQKLRRFNPGAAFGFEQQLGELERLLPQGLPASFGMHDKARFALGFYHQKAFRARRAPETEPENLPDTNEPTVQKASS
jgi:CRISPR-associated protein Csd1